VVRWGEDIPIDVDVIYPARIEGRVLPGVGFGCCGVF
jgi:hypothetical protein